MKELILKSKNRIFYIFGKHTILKLIGVIVVIYLLNLGIRWLPTLQIRYSAPPDINKEALAESGGTIANDAEETLVAETDTKKLYIDPVTLNLRVEDKTTGKSWNSIQSGGSEKEKSLLNISYIGEDNTLLTWDSYTYAVKDKTYTVDKIDGGVRINLAMKELDSLRINEYVPQKITIEKYEKTFLKGLEDMAAAGEITPEEKEKYDTALSLTYAKDEEHGCYYNRYSKAPPISVVNQLIQVTKLLNYTKDQLMADNADFGITVDIVEPASFIIPIEAVLDGDDFLVRIPTNQIQTENKYYTITRIDVFPYFGSVSAADTADGYILIPDGSGALLNLNEFNASFGTYSRAVYNNTFYNDLYYLNSYPETLHMPVFGMTYGKGSDSTGGYMGIIEQGDETAFITANLASVEKGGGGGAYNKAFSSFDATQYAQVGILGPYDSSGGKFMSSTGMMNIDYKVRYKLFPGKVTYFDMAKSYQAYLVNKYDLTVSYDQKAKLYLDVVGSLTLEERILGIPYNKVISMTTYKELKDILADLKGTPLVVDYLGMFDDGMNNQVMNRADLTKANGSKKQLDDLISFAESNQQELYFQTDFSRVYAKGNGFRLNTHGVYNFNGYPTYIYGYDFASGAFDGLKKPYNIVNPVYLTSIVNGFLKNAGDYKNLYIDDLATDYYANYRKNKIVSPAQSQAIIDENLAKLTQTKTLSLNNPDMNKIIYGKYATNISRESSGYGAFAAEIPFRQLVMNGLISYTTLNVNESGTRSDYFLLQALELGSCPKFTITAKSLDLIKNSVYSEFVSREYGLISKDIKDLYSKYDEAFQQINSMEITNHEILADSVYETTYANGVKVITNYNKYPVSIDNQEIDALGYLIIQ